ncbi:MAG: phage major capsid protein [Frankiaceae bacterium]
MPGIKQLEEQGRALLADQKSLVEDASRNWSEKRDEYDAREKDIKAVLEQVTALKALNGSPFASLQDSNGEQQDTAAKSLGQQVTEADNFKSGVFGAKGQRFNESFDLKVAGNVTLTGSPVTVPTYLPNAIPTLFRRLTIADLMPQGTMASGSLIYPQETAYTNAAATVAEGGQKPLSDITLAQVTETARKIATVAKISDEMLQDIGYIQSYIDGRLVLFVQLAEEDQLLNGNGTAPNLRGLMNRTGLAASVAVPGTPTQTDRVDSLYSQISALRATAYLDPDGIVMNPTDWKTIRLNKDANNQYFGGGPFTGAYGVGAMPGDNGNLGENPSLWGCRVIVTPAIAAGTALVGAFGMGAQVFRRTGITVEMTNSNEDDFKNNLVAIRAEERLALAVYRPGAFGKVTGL